MKLRLLALLPVLALAACKPTANELKIGVSAPMTGGISATGQSAKNAIALVQDELNAGGGVKVGEKTLKVRFITEDDEDKPESTATVFQKLTFQGRVVAQFATSKLKAKTAAVLFDVASDYNKGIAEVFRDEFAKMGGKLVGFETYNTKDTDFSAQLTKIKGANPDVIFLPNYFNEVPLQIQQARKLGIKATMLGADGWDNPELVKLGGAVMDGAYFSNHYSPDVDEANAQAFIAKYKARFGIVPDAAAALTYDSAQLIAKAVVSAGKADSKSIRDALAAITGHKGVTGTITYGGGGDPVKGAVVIKVNQGKFVFDSAVNP